MDEKLCKCSCGGDNSKSDCCEKGNKIFSDGYRLGFEAGVRNVVNKMKLYLKYKEKFLARTL